MGPAQVSRQGASTVDGAWDSNFWNTATTAVPCGCKETLKLMCHQFLASFVVIPRRKQNRE